MSFIIQFQELLEKELRTIQGLSSPEERLSRFLASGASAALILSFFGIAVPEELPEGYVQEAEQIIQGVTFSLQDSAGKQKAFTQLLSEVNNSFPLTELFLTATSFPGQFLSFVSFLTDFFRQHIALVKREDVKSILPDERFLIELSSYALQYCLEILWMFSENKQLAAPCSAEQKKVFQNIYDLVSAMQQDSSLAPSYISWSIMVDRLSLIAEGLEFSLDTFSKTSADSLLLN